MTVDGFALLQVVHDEFERTPNLQVSLAEAQLRWQVDVGSLQAALQALVRIGYLAQSPLGVYSRRAGAAGDPAALAPHVTPKVPSV